MGSNGDGGPPLIAGGGPPFVPCGVEARGAQVVPKSVCPVRTSPTNAAQAAGLNARAGPFGSLESRTPTTPRVAITSAISTQLLPEPPLYEDLHQASWGASSGAGV
jgi:hypothetical protein